MTLDEGNNVFNIVVNLSDNSRGVEGDEVELCELKGDKLHLGNPCDLNHLFLSAVIKVQVHAFII